MNRHRVPSWTGWWFQPWFTSPVIISNWFVGWLIFFIMTGFQPPTRWFIITIYWPIWMLVHRTASSWLNMDDLSICNRYQAWSLDHSEQSTPWHPWKMIPWKMATSIVACWIKQRLTLHNTNQWWSIEWYGYLMFNTMIKRSRLNHHNHCPRSMLGTHIWLFSADNSVETTVHGASADHRQEFGFVHVCPSMVRP